MKKYFYTDGNENYGPFTLEELEAQGITRETLVWYEGIDDWKPAGSVFELNPLFRTPPPRPAHMPPPVPENMELPESAPYPAPVRYQEKPPKNWLIESILTTIFCCLPFGIAGIVNAAKVESRFYAGDYGGALAASEEAKKWTMVSFWIGLVFGVIYLFVMILGFALG